MTLHRHCALCRADGLSAAPERSGPGAKPRRRWRADAVATMNALTMVITLAGLTAAGAAAAMLLDSADALRQQGSRATDDATAMSLGHLTVMDVYGEAAATGVGRVLELVTTATATEAIDLSEVSIVLTSGLQKATFTYDPTGAAGFSARAVRDRDGSFTAETPVITDGDLVELSLPVAQAGFVIAPRDSVHQALYNEAGLAMTTLFHAPPTFAGAELVDFSE